MAVQIAKDGYFEIEYTFQGATGLDVQTPENLLSDKASSAVSNFLLRNSEARSRPVFRREFPAPPNSNPALGQTSFLDVNSVWHTVLFTGGAAYQLAGNNQKQNVSPWKYLGGPNLIAGNPVASQAFGQVLYYTNGGPVLGSWDGITAAPTASNAGCPGATSVAAIDVADAPTVVPGSTGPLSIGGLYLGELNNSILLQNVVVLDNATNVLYQFPNRLWWSANGIPTQWDPTINTSAGFNDFLDVPDVFSGLMTIGIAGYLFRSNGITQFTPTGSAQTPFQFDHLWASKKGIGDVFPWSLAQYGPSGFFASTEQIYKMSVNSFNPIGGSARDAIYADLASASGNPIGAFLPNLGRGYIYPMYTLSIPLGNFTRHYQYSDEGNYWTPWDTKGLLITGAVENVWTGQLPSYGVPGVFPPAVSNGGTGMSGGGGMGSGTGGGSGGGSTNGRGSRTL